MDADANDEEHEQHDEKRTEYKKEKFGWFNHHHGGIFYHPPS